MGDSDSDSIRSDEEEILEAAHAARSSTGWEREVENYRNGLSAEDCSRTRAIEGKARDIMGDISVLKTDRLH